jgi:sortase (surface protein transpeptidase)
LESLGVDGAGALRGPVDFAKAGWFTGGVVPGEIGPAVIAGHVDSETGPAVFYRLRDLKAGDVVEVLRGDRWIPFRVVASERYPKNQFPTERVYRPTPVPELRVITCGGTFDRSRRSYEDNIVVYAVAA